MCKELQQKVHQIMSNAAIEATGFVRRMVREESAGWGDEAEALRRIARGCKTSFWTLNNLRIGRAKTVNSDLRDRIRDYFVEHCRSHAARLLRDAEVAAKENNNVVLGNIQDEIRALAARLETAKGEAKREAVK